MIEFNSGKHLLKWLLCIINWNRNNFKFNNITKNCIAIYFQIDMKVTLRHILGWWVMENLAKRLEIFLFHIVMDNYIYFIMLQWLECCPSCKPSNETKFKWNQWITLRLKCKPNIFAIDNSNKIDNYRCLIAYLFLRFGFWTTIIKYIKLLVPWWIYNLFWRMFRCHFWEKFVQNICNFSCTVVRNIQQKINGP